MAKKTVFTGVINGEKFDSVADYNARMNELLSQGVENISAASSTEIRNVDENVATSGYVSTCTADQCPGTCTSVSTSASTELPEDFDEDASFYPYMEDDDPYYLDLLATEDENINKEALEEASDVFDKSYDLIVEVLNNPETNNAEREEYLVNIDEIIENINKDILNTNNAKSMVEDKRNRLNAEFEAFKKKYEDELEKAKVEETVLNAATNVSNLFLDFYSAVKNEVHNAIKNHEANCRVNRLSKVKRVESSDNITTTIRESSPQAEIKDFQKLMDSIFGPKRLF